MSDFDQRIKKLHRQHFLKDVFSALGWLLIGAGIWSILT
jgi:hypothetical protein